MPFDHFLRVAIASYFVMVGVFYAMKLVGHRLRSGERLQSFGAVGSAQWIGRATFEAFRWAIVILCVVRVPWPQIGDALGPIRALESVPLQSAGLALMLAGLALVGIAHNYLGPDWRTGVPESGPVTLLTDGPYRWVRHPIFMGVHLGQIGLFLAWPTLFTLVCLLVGGVVIQIQARVEDRRLKHAFGAAFERYARITPGFWPRSIGSGR